VYYWARVKRGKSGGRENKSGRKTLSAWFRERTGLEKGGLFPKVGGKPGNARRRHGGGEDGNDWRGKGTQSGVAQKGKTNSGGRVMEENRT